MAAAARSLSKKNQMIRITNMKRQIEMKMEISFGSKLVMALLNRKILKT